MIPDGAGGESHLYQGSVKKVQTWIGIIIGIVTIIGAVAAGVKIGVESEVREQIKDECGPHGIIDNSVERRSTEVIEEVQVVIQDDLDVLETRINEVEDSTIRLEAGQQSIKEQQTRNHDELKILLGRSLDGG